MVQVHPLPRVSAENRTCEGVQRMWTRAVQVSTISNARGLQSSLKAVVE